MQYLNKSKLYKLVSEELDSDYEVFENLFTILRTQYKQLENVDKNQITLNELSELAHKIKSSSRSFGADTLVSHLETMESASKQNDKNKAIKSLENVQNSIKPTLEEIMNSINEFKAQ